MCFRAYFKLIVVRYGNIIQHFVLTNEAVVILSSCYLVIIIIKHLYYANGVYMVI